MERRRIAIAGTSALAFFAALGIAGAMMTSAPQVYADAEATSDDVITMGEWGEQYPLERNSYRVQPVKADGRTHGHYDLQLKLLAPVDRQGTTLLTDENGYYAISGFEYDEQSHQWVIAEDVLGAVPANAFKQGCYSCKSSNFDVAYEQNGAEIFTIDPTDDFIATIDGQVWDCACCHDGDPAVSAPDAQLTYWTQLARDSFDELEADERLCGQCHNSYDYRSRVLDQETMDSFAPYRYGFDLDAIYTAAIEDGIYTVDEKTGIVLSCLDHPDVEFTQGSAMRELGVTCVDCHMPKTVDEETGVTYTDHGASNSPLENEVALEYCLTCHAAQGIETTEDMAAMVREAQAEAAANQDVVDAKFDAAYELIAAAVASGEVDEETLQLCRDNYSVAEAYFHAVTGSAGNGVKVAHNPGATASYIAQAGVLLDEVIELLS